MADTHISNITGRYKIATTDPTNPVIGDYFFDPIRNYRCQWTGNNWICIIYTTTSTSTSTSTSSSTTTSTTTTTTSTSTSTTTSTSTSTTTTG